MRILVKVLVAGGLGAAIGVGGLSPGTAATQGAVRFAELSLPKATAEQDSANRVAYQSLEDASPDKWGGAYVDGEQFVIKVVGTDLEHASAELKAVGVTAGVRLESSAVSVTDLRAQKARVGELVRGTKGVRSWGPNYAEGAIVVDADGDQASIREALGTLKAPDRPDIVMDDAGGPAVTASNTRYFDLFRWWGGDAIRLTSPSNGTIRNCSTGFALNPSGNSYSVTAAHCFVNHSVATGVVNRFQNSTTVTPIGDIVSSSANSAGTYSDRNGDVAVYQFRPVAGASSYDVNQGRVYTGNGNTSTWRRVVGTKRFYQGDHTAYLRTSGASGLHLGNSGYGEISPDWISLVDQDIYYSNIDATYTNLTVAEDASECVRSGDSGGAFYMQSGSDALAVGVVSGTNNQGGGPLNCRNYYTPVHLWYFSNGVRLG